MYLCKTEWNIYKCSLISTLKAFCHKIALTKLRNHQKKLLVWLSGIELLVKWHSTTSSTSEMAAINMSYQDSISLSIIFRS